LICAFDDIFHVLPSKGNKGKGNALVCYQLPEIPLSLFFFWVLGASKKKKQCQLWSVIDRSSTGRRSSRM